MPDIEKFKSLIGYGFQNRALLREALTHRSYAVENALEYDNQRLEFLGDAVLEIVLTEYLFNLYPEHTEGDLTKLRSALAREETLAELARQLHFGEFIFMGRGELESGGPERDSTLADLFEAILGAWYLDGGFEPVRQFILQLMRQYYPHPDRFQKSLNPKGLLQEYCQHRWGMPPHYEILSTTGPEHNPVYVVQVTINHHSAQGTAQNRKNAESQAAALLLKTLEQS